MQPSLASRGPSTGPLRQAHTQSTGAGDAASTGSGSISGRGLLAHCPPDVVGVLNGQPLTRADIRAARQRYQKRRLAWKQHSWLDITVPAFIWTFYVPCFPFGPGWWVYIRTRRGEWGKHLDPKFIVQAMSLYPCGFLPIMENYSLWARAFAETYPRITGRPGPQGMALCHARISSSGILLALSL